MKAIAPGSTIVHDGPCGTHTYRSYISKCFVHADQICCHFNNYY